MEEIQNPGVFKIGRPFPELLKKHLIGQGYINQMITTDVSIYNLTLSPGCRNNWHIHHNYRQILLVTGGRGWYQEWGRVPQALKPGDVINIEPEVKHWHGAAADSWFSHVVVETRNEDNAVEWLEPVDDAYYLQVEMLNIGNL